MQTNPAQEITVRPTGVRTALKLVERRAPGRTSGQKESSRIAIKDKGTILFIDPNDVVAVVAQGNYVLLQCESGSYCLRESISVIAAKLGPYGFVRIHRSALVNRFWVEEVDPYFAGECLLRTRGGRRFRVTSTYKKNLKSLADLWLSNAALPGVTRSR
jgi:two-component system, LytTR family, response regulator